MAKGGRGSVILHYVSWIDHNSATHILKNRNARGDRRLEITTYELQSCWLHFRARHLKKILSFQRLGSDFIRDYFNRKPENITIFSAEIQSGWRWLQSVSVSPK